MEWSCAACGARWPETHAFCGFCGQARARTTDTGAAEVDEVLRALVGEQLRGELIAQGGRLPEERRLVSAVFADLSGFTPLAGRLDPERLAEVVDPILEALVRIVKRHEGYVGSFAGDALLAYFGAPVTHEDDAARAVRASAEMLAEFPALLAVAPPEAGSLSLRIGVDTGAVMARLVAGDIRTDYNILGNSVNMAQRLQSNAPPGGLVVGETTHRLTRELFRFEPLGAETGGIMVKGRDTPLPAFLYAGDRDAAVLRRAARGLQVVGRDEEAALLARAEQAGGTLVVRAEAGQGKSTLLDLARQSSAATWLLGGCAPHDTATAHRPWRSVLSRLEESLAGLAGVRLVTGAPVSDDLERLAPAARRDLVARDVATALRALAPAVVVLEDLHWADQATLDLADDLAHLPREPGLLLVLTSREEVPLTTPVEELALPPLGGEAAAALVGELLGGVPPDVLVEDLVTRSGGNPLFLAELATALRDRGLVELAEGGVLVAAGSDLASALDLVPDSLEGLVGARIDALPTAQERVLTIASVLGAPVDERLVSAVAVRMALPHQEVPAAMAALRSGGLLDGPHFVHAVVQSTAYVRVTRARRRQLHLAAADACGPLVPESDRPGFLARHLYLAGAGPRAVAALALAADEAQRAGRHEEAVLHLRREVELRRTPDADDAQRAALGPRLVVLGSLLELMARYTDAVPVLEEARTRDARDETAARALVGSLRRLGRFDEAIALAEQVRADSDSPATRDWTGEELGWAYAAQGDLDTAWTVTDGGSTELARARLDIVRGYVLIQRNDLAGVESLVAPALDVADRAGDLALLARARRVLGSVIARQGDWAGGRVMLEAGLSTARACGAAEEVTACLNNLIGVGLGSGALTDAVAWARDAVLAADRMRHTFGRTVTRNNLADALTTAGEPSSAVGSASEALALAESHGLGGMVGPVLNTRGAALLATGDVDAAAADAERALPLVLDTEDEEETRDLLDAIEAARAGAQAAPMV